MKICPALTNENYDYHLSGDCRDYCLCLINGNACIGRVIDDPEERSSQFFSREKCSIDKDKIKSCPVFGSSIEIIKLIIKERQESILKDKLENL